jgi:hypothetical protein
MKTSEYEKQAKDFLERFGLEFQATKHPNQKAPNWEDASKARQNWSEVERKHVASGFRYLVTITKKDGQSVEFDFWGSIDARVKAVRNGFGGVTMQHPTAYDVLACISGDASAPDDADEVAAEFGIVKPSQALAIVEFGRKLRAFFTQEELEALSEIQ